MGSFNGVAVTIMTTCFHISSVTCDNCDPLTLEWKRLHPVPFTWRNVADEENPDFRYIKKTYLLDRPYKVPHRGI